MGYAWRTVPRPYLGLIHHHHHPPVHPLAPTTFARACLARWTRGVLRGGANGMGPAGGRYSGYGQCSRFRSADCGSRQRLGQPRPTHSLPRPLPGRCLCLVHFALPPSDGGWAPIIEYLPTQLHPPPLCRTPPIPPSRMQRNIRRPSGPARGQPPPLRPAASACGRRRLTGDLMLAGLGVGFRSGLGLSGGGVRGWTQPLAPQGLGYYPRVWVSMQVPPVPIEPGVAVQTAVWPTPVPHPLRPAHPLALSLPGPGPPFPTSPWVQSGSGEGPEQVRSGSKVGLE
mmetsp:Transcript_44355/g.79558  ORF Transcript_44355/g.79558 Transcript_44355/m.79558 type:complete len:284 (-) Transcript_44355:472-1323(-)